MRTLSSLVSVSLLGLLLAGCASGSPVTAFEPQRLTPPAVSPSSHQPTVPRHLDCRGAGTFSTDGGLFAKGAEPKGFGTPEQAVEDFLQVTDLGVHDYVVDVPHRAWALRGDGTAMARLDLLREDGWLVHGYTRCM